MAAVWRGNYEFYRERLALQVGHVQYLYALDGIDDILRVGSQFGNALLEVKHFLGEFRRFQARRPKQLNGVFQKHLVRVDRLRHTKSHTKTTFSLSTGKHSSFSSSRVRGCRGFVLRE